MDRSSRLRIVLNVSWKRIPYPQEEETISEYSIWIQRTEVTFTVRVDTNQRISYN
jgi:hypothetical protein